MASPAEAQRFYQDGLHQLDHLLIGEREAKIGVLAAMVMGENILLVGLPGGGKTTLAVDSYRLVEDIEQSRVADIPPMADLRPEQLVGGAAETRKSITVDGKSRDEVTKNTMAPIITEDTQVIVANEINRMNPYALNASLEAFESGTITTTSGTTHLKGLEYAVSTMNPAESRQAVFPIAAAMASRHTLGVVLGERSEHSRNAVIRDIAGGWKPNPSRIDQVIDVATLHELREQVPSMPIPGDLMDDTIRMVAGTADKLAEAGIQEADGRMTKQITETAKALAILNAQERVEKRQLTDAVKYVLGARLGALSAKAAVEIPRLHAQIIG